MNAHRECTGETGHSHRRALMSHESADFVVRRLFTAGLAVGSCVRLLDDASGERIAAVIAELDAIGRDVRRAALRQGRQAEVIGGDPHREALITGMNDMVGEITFRLDALGRTEPTDEVTSPHLLDAVQSLERALAYLRDGGGYDRAVGDIAFEPCDVRTPHPQVAVTPSARQGRPVRAAARELASG